MTRYVIGMDGGSTKTAGVMLDEQGTPVAQASGGPSNYHTVGLDSAEEHLFAVIGGLLFGLSKKCIEVGHDGLEVTQRLFDHKWRGKGFHYRAVQELRRSPVPGIGKWILVARMQHRAIEFGKELSTEELAWLESLVRRQVALQEPAKEEH